MKIIITGATGLIGRVLVKKLSEKGYDIIILTRNVHKGNKFSGTKINYIEWNGFSSHEIYNECNGEYAIINLAGANIGKTRWTGNGKKTIIESRVNAGHAVAHAIELAAMKPAVVIQASATGFYDGLSGELADESSPVGKRFISNVASQWEESVGWIKDSGIRLVVIRTGVVLSAEGGALGRMIRPIKLFVGGRLGSGKQWVSWIHMEDEVQAILFLLENKELSGVFNLVAPEPVQMETFLKTAASFLKRPYWLPVPAYLIRFFLGELGKELILSGENVSSRKLVESGYIFSFPQLKTALEDIIVKR